MKKTFIIALALLVAGASFGTAEAAKDKKKKKKQQEIEAPIVDVFDPVILRSGSDSLSYAAGMMLTNGLTEYLQRQLKVDTAYMADFVSAC